MKAIFLAVLMMAAMGAQAAPNENTGVDCDVVANAQWEIFAAHRGPRDSDYDGDMGKGYLVGRLKDFCAMGVGMYLQGKSFSDAPLAVESLNEVVPQSLGANTVLLFAVQAGHQLASLHAIEKRHAAEDAAKLRKGGAY